MVTPLMGPWTLRIDKLTLHSGETHRSDNLQRCIDAFQVSSTSHGPCVQSSGRFEARNWQLWDIEGQQDGGVRETSQGRGPRPEIWPAGSLARLMCKEKKQWGCGPRGRAGVPRDLDPKGAVQRQRSIWRFQREHLTLSAGQEDFSWLWPGE